MAGQAFLPHGTTVTFDGDDIGGLNSIGLPDESRGDVEVTDNDSGGSREYLPGLREPGTIALEGRIIPGDVGQDRLRTNKDTEDQPKEVVITLPASATDDSTVVTYTFDAYVSALGGDLPQDSDDPGQFTATLKVTGAVTVAVA